MSKPVPRFPFVLFIAAIVLSVPLVLGFLGGIHPAFDTLSLLRAHLAVLLILLSLPLLFTPMRREGAMILLFAILAFGTTLSATRDLMGKGKSGANAAVPIGARYSLVQINLGGSATDPKRILQMIAREKPDFIAYQGADQAWSEWLNILNSSYRYHVDCRENGVGVGILSRRPLSESDEKLCGAEGRYAAAKFNLGGTNVSVASIGLDWPWPGKQIEALKTVAPEFSKLSGPAILAGDFKATPWTRGVRQIERETGMRIIGSTGGTWLPRPIPATFAPLMRLPLDHVLASTEIEAPNISLRDEAGSSHLPVRLDFTVAPPSRHEEEEPDTNLSYTKVH